MLSPTDQMRPGMTGRLIGPRVGDDVNGAQANVFLAPHLIRHWATRMSSIERFFVICAVCLGSWVSADAQAQSPRSAAYNSCMDKVDLGAFKNTQWAACAAQEMKRQDVALNAEYNKLRNALALEQRDLLVKAQRAWLRFRQEWCTLDAASSSAPGGEVNFNFCMLELTDRQIQAIKALQ